MASRNEQLVRVGSAVQMGAMIAQMVDSNTTGLDDRAAKIAASVGRGLVRAGSGDANSGGDILIAAGEELVALGEELKAEKAAK